MAKWFFRHGELPLVVLALLEREPMTGYRLLGELDLLFGEAYEPSTGSVYPAIRALQHERLITGTPHGPRNGQVVQLTELGRDALRARGEQLAGLELRTGVRVRRDALLEHALDRFVVRLRATTGQIDPKKVSEILERTASDIENIADTGGGAA
ncbi:MAG: PadR family transcriptional regulator [Acidimicrobiia bacterium]